MRRRGLLAAGILAWLFAVSVAPAAAQGEGDGGALFKTKCSPCHSQKKVLDDVRKQPEAERPAHLDRFLTGHYAPDATERKAICEYLMNATAR